MGLWEADTKTGLDMQESLLEKMFVKGNKEKTWERMRETCQSMIQIWAGEGGGEESRGCRASETPVQLLEKQSHQGVLKPKLPTRGIPHVLSIGRKKTLRNVASAQTN